VVVSSLILHQGKVLIYIGVRRVPDLSGRVVSGRSLTARRPNLEMSVPFEVISASVRVRSAFPRPHAGRGLHWPHGVLNHGRLPSRLSGSQPTVHSVGVQ
jgi:hypothetical protein